jgi:hypothetical protein
VDATDGAAVRIAMTVGSTQSQAARMAHVVRELDQADGETRVELQHSSGVIHADLRIGANIGSAQALRANDGIAGMGVALHGSGFILGPDTATRLRADGAAVIKPYLAGRDLLQERRERYLIDFFGMSEAQARTANPAAFQHVIDHVKPERDQNNRKALKEFWWRFGWERPQLRKALRGLSRYIGTTETSKHRPFQFIAADVMADHSIVCIAESDAAVLAILSSTTHVAWSFSAGGTLEDRPRYNKTRCFDPFPFPIATDEQQTHLRALAEQLDAHRKRQQAAHPELTLTGMYNVLDKLRSGEALSAKERVIHEHGLVSVLRQLHDEIDAAVLDAYGWSDLLPLLRVAMGASVDAGEAALDPAAAKRSFDEAILERLVALNAERAAEEARGVVRWLRPDFQHPAAQAAPSQGELPDAGDGAATSTTGAIAVKPQPWPRDPVAQVRAVADALAASPAALGVDDLAARFTARGAWKKRLPQLLDMLVTLGRAQEHDGRYSA